MRQGASLLAGLVKNDKLGLSKTKWAEPQDVLAPARRRLPELQSLLKPHQQAMDDVERALKTVDLP